MLEHDYVNVLAIAVDADIPKDYFSNPQKIYRKTQTLSLLDQSCSEPVSLTVWGDYVEQLEEFIVVEPVIFVKAA